MWWIQTIFLSKYKIIGTFWNFTPIAKHTHTGIVLLMVCLTVGSKFEKMVSSLNQNRTRYFVMHATELTVWQYIPDSIYQNIDASLTVLIIQEFRRFGKGTGSFSLCVGVGQKNRSSSLGFLLNVFLFDKWAHFSFVLRGRRELGGCIRRLVGNQIYNRFGKLSIKVAKLELVHSI